MARRQQPGGQEEFMMEEKYHIEKNTIQETLVIPLWGRKFATEIFGDIYQDPKSAPRDI